MNINVVTISGNLTRDGELRANNVLAFSVAVNERRKNGDEWEDYANYLDCVLFGPRASALASRITKGTKVLIAGSLRQSRYETSDGQKRSKVEVVVSDIDIQSKPTPALSDNDIPF